MRSHRCCCTAKPRLRRLVGRQRRRRQNLAGCEAVLRACCTLTKQQAGETTIGVGRRRSGDRAKPCELCVLQSIIIRNRNWHFSFIKEFETRSESSTHDAIVCCRHTTRSLDRAALAQSWLTSAGDDSIRVPLQQQQQQPPAHFCV